MRETFGKGTNAPFRQCTRRIFFTEAEVTERDGRQWFELKCLQPGCVAYYKPLLYDKEAVEIHDG